MKVNFQQMVREFFGKSGDNRVPDRVNAGEYDSLLDELHHRAFLEIEADFGNISNPSEVYVSDDEETRIEVSRLIKVLDVEVADVVGENAVFIRFETADESLGYFLKDVQATQFGNSLGVLDLNRETSVAETILSPQAEDME